MQLTAKAPLRRSWCAKCSGKLHIAEELCRAVIEASHGHPFPSRYPGDWLRNSRHRKMQLDGYCEALALAFEYQGQQHYQDVGRYKRGADGLSKRIEDDATKARLCAERGIALVVIPYFESAKLTLDHVIQHIRTSFSAASVPFPSPDPERIEAAIATSLSQPMLRVRELATARHGECLSPVYLGMTSKYIWRCKDGHTWQASADSIKSGSWCADCAGRPVVTIEQMHTHAETRGGKCLSTEYINAHLPLRWECGTCSHVWEAKASNIVHKGYWCPRCAGILPSSIEEMRALAISRGGKCLSTEYANSASRLIWECGDCKNRWEASVQSVRGAGSWCPPCGAMRVIQKGRDSFYSEIKTHGLTALSEYAGALKPVTIACPSGHQNEFKTAGSLKKALKRGVWQCGECLTECNRSSHGSTANPSKGSQRR